MIFANVRPQDRLTSQLASAGGTNTMVRERRAGMRQPVNQEVMIIHDQGHRLCKIHDLSLKGAMLDLGWGALTRDVPVELTILLPSAGGNASFRLPARVARVSTAGTAIMFHDLDSGAQQAMQHYLKSGQQTS